MEEVKALQIGQRGRKRKAEESLKDGKKRKNSISPIVWSMVCKAHAPINEQKKRKIQCQKVQCALKSKREKGAAVLSRWCQRWHSRSPLANLGFSKLLWRHWAWLAMLVPMPCTLIGPRRCRRHHLVSLKVAVMTGHRWFETNHGSKTRLNDGDDGDFLNIYLRWCCYTQADQSVNCYPGSGGEVGVGWVQGVCTAFRCHNWVTVTHRRGFSKGL